VFRKDETFLVLGRFSLVFGLRLFEKAPTTKGAAGRRFSECFEKMKLSWFLEGFHWFSASDYLKAPTTKEAAGRRFSECSERMKLPEEFMSFRLPRSESISKNC
jgi:hypothetical protein